ncbi:MAG TPA: uracil-DNA glycosylase [bacterium]|nr:uracil-DNA glycosylase [bacterium]
MVVDKAKTLERLHSRILECTRCPLHLTRTQAVPGTGSADAEIVFVGEAPGRQEDMQGTPFVGGAGRVFDGLLASIGLSRADVYITNTVKSRPFVGPPPGRNRSPTPAEITACAPWLTEEMQLIRPKLLITLGQIALNQFLPRRKLSEVHGNPQRTDGVTILPLYHPAMARYGPEWTAILRADFLKISKVMTSQSRT